MATNTFKLQEKIAMPTDHTRMEKRSFPEEPVKNSEGGKGGTKPACSRVENHNSTTKTEKEVAAIPQMTQEAFAKATRMMRDIETTAGSPRHSSTRSRGHGSEHVRRDVGNKACKRPDAQAERGGRTDGQYRERTPKPRSVDGKEVRETQYTLHERKGQ